MVRACLKSCEERKSLVRMSSKEASSGRKIGVFQFSNQKAQDEIIEASHNPSCVFACHASLVFAEGHISTVVQAILNAPVGAGHLQEPVGRNLFPGQAGDAIDDLFFDFPSLGEDEASFEFEDLLLVGPIQEVFELAAHREGALLDPSMPFIHALGGFEILGKVGLAG